jgi:hypothetical protein
MADIPQVLATYDALVGVAIGAGLTYGFGALNRRHQEAREDRTRWYEARLQAYTDLQRAVGSGDVLRLRLHPSLEAYDEVTLSLLSALGAVRLVGSQDVVIAAERLAMAVLAQVANYADEVVERVEGKTEGLSDAERKPEWSRVLEPLQKFVMVARKDLGHP